MIDEIKKIKMQTKKGKIISNFSKMSKFLRSYFLMLTFGLFLDLQYDRNFLSYQYELLKVLIKRAMNESPNILFVCL